MRADDNFLCRIDEWRRQQPDLPSRSEGVRRLVIKGMRNDEKPDDEFFELIDDWRRRQSEDLSRSEAVRKLIEEARKGESFELFLLSLLSYLGKSHPNIEKDTLLVTMRLYGLLESDDLPTARKLLTDKKWLKRSDTNRRKG